MTDSILYLPSVKVLLTQGVHNWTLTEEQLKDNKSPQKFCLKRNFSLTFSRTDTDDCKNILYHICNRREQILDYKRNKKTVIYIKNSL